MNESFNPNRVAWRSRRGMLELDLVLAPFVEHDFVGLKDEDKARYVAMLEEEDQDMFRWFLKAEAPSDPEIAKIVSLILKRHSERGAS